eukprot:m.20672 g.20672  ORF g.20672 m.20672 type:complete len:455 (+) comp6918_c0_seq1:168-1532(+)
MNRLMRTGSLLGWGAPKGATPLIQGYLDPDTELAPWFVSGMSKAELTTVIDDLAHYGQEGSFIVKDAEIQGKSDKFFTLMVLEGSTVNSYDIKSTKKGFKFASSSDVGPQTTISELVEICSTEVHSPLQSILDTSTTFMSTFSELASRKTSKRRNDSVKSQLSTISGFGGAEEDDGTGGIAGLFMEIEQTKEQDADEALVLAAVKLEQMENAVRLRESLRNHSAVLQESDRRSVLLQDPFWQDKQEALERELSYKKRFKDKEVLDAEEMEQQAVLREKERLAELELKALKKEVRKVKRMSMQKGITLPPVENMVISDPAEELIAAMTQSNQHDPVSYVPSIDDDDENDDDFNTSFGSGAGFTRRNSSVRGFRDFPEALSDNDPDDEKDEDEVVQGFGDFDSDDDEGENSDTKITVEIEATEEEQSVNPNNNIASTTQDETKKRRFRKYDSPSIR